MLLSRGLAAVLAALSLVPAYFGALIAMLTLLIAAERPDPTVADGDPCCGYPDTWGEVAWGVAWGLLVAAVSVALLYVAITLGEYAIKGERPRLLRVRRIVASLLGAIGLPVAVTLLFWALA